MKQIEWTGASNMHRVFISNKPCPEGFCIKTVADGITRILSGGEFIESPIEMSRMHIKSCSSKVASTTLRVMWPDANLPTTRVLMCDAWFGTLATARLLQRHGIECALNMKGRRKGLPRELLMKEALPADQRKHQRGDCAHKYVDVKLHAQAEPKRLYAACQTDSKPMSLLCTFGTDKEPCVPQKRTRAYRDSDGVLQNFVPYEM